MYKINKQPSFVLGCDGCGVITQLGAGVPQKYLGKKVSFVGGGWATYVVKLFKFVVVLNEEQDLKTAANAYVNPFTALAIVDFAKNKYQGKCIV